MTLKKFAALVLILASCAKNHEVQRRQTLKTHQRPFVTKWKGKKITIPVGYGDFNYEVDWNNDGQYESKNNTKSITHVYQTRGPHLISIRGRFPHFKSTEESQKQLLSIVQWGDIRWESMTHSFKGSIYLAIDAKDAPNLLNVEDLDHTFANTPINQPLEHWDVSTIQSMNHTFWCAKNFNQPLNGWDVSNVKSMVGLFDNASSFNQPLDKWNVSNVVDTTNMFQSAEDFNQSLHRWNVSNVKYASSMFYNAKQFNQPLNNWDVSGFETMRYMFGMASRFNQPLNTWDVSKVKSTYGMFVGASAFDQSLGSWHMASNRNAKGMLDGSGLSITNYDDTIKKWASQPYNHITLGADGLVFCSSASERTQLEYVNRWHFVGDKKCQSIKKKAPQ